MRVLLNLAIFINLMIDGCARFHGIAASEKYLQQYFR